MLSIVNTVGNFYSFATTVVEVQKTYKPIEILIASQERDPSAIS